MSLADHLFPLDRPETRGECLHARIVEGFAALSAVVFAFRWAEYLQGVSSLPFPTGVARWLPLDWVLAPGVAFGAVGLLALLVGLGWARVTRWAYPAAIVVLHLMYAARHSLGKTSHGSHLVGLTLLAFAIAVVSFRDESVRRRVGVGMALFFVGLSYLWAAVSKLVASGGMWSDGRHLVLWIAEKQVDLLSRTGADGLNVLQEMVLAAPWVGTVLLTIGVVSEACGPLLWWRQTRVWAALLLIGMHIGILLTMNIFFYTYIVHLAILALPWSSLFDLMLARRAAPPGL